MQSASCRGLQANIVWTQPFRVWPQKGQFRQRRLLFAVPQVHWVFSSIVSFAHLKHFHLTSSLVLQRSPLTRRSTYRQVLTDPAPSCRERYKSSSAEKEGRPLPGCIQEGSWSKEKSYSKHLGLIVTSILSLFEKTALAYRLLPIVIRAPCSIYTYKTMQTLLLYSRRIKVVWTFFSPSQPRIQHRSLRWLNVNFWPSAWQS